MSKTVFQNLNSMLNLNPEPEEKCKHSSTAYTEVLKHTIVDTHHPISNSRVQSINDFEVGRVKEIKVPALKCLECGEIIEIKHSMVASTASTHNYESPVSSGTMALGQHSMAIGYNSTAFGCANIAIGASAGSRVNTDRDNFKYAGDYSERSFTDKGVIDMGFLNDMKEALENAEKRQDKALKNYKNKQNKLDNIAEKVRQLRNNISGDGTTNTLMTEIDKIKAEYDVIVSRQKAVQQKALTQQQQFTNNDFLTGSVREAASVIGKVGATLIPAPPPIPQARKVGAYGVGSDKGYYQSTPPPNIDKFTDIEYVQFLIRGTEVEEKTFKDIKYFDFTFSHPMDQENALLNILDKGDVIEWVKVAKNQKMGMLSPKIKAIKAIRISVKDLEEARKEQTNES